MTNPLGTGFTLKPRWDKYNGYVGNFRAPLAADVDLDTEANVVLPAGIDSNGAVVFGAGQSGIVGVVIIPVGTNMQGTLLDGGVNTGAGDICDVGKHGEIVNFADSAGNNAAGTNYFANADGTVTPDTGDVYIGHTVEADRLIVDVTDSDLSARVYAIENP